ncbi:MAG: hypothetical protein Kow0062_15950 [Acidobacteriota bacterium]
MSEHDPPITDEASAADRLAAALARARENDRLLLVIFGADWCPDCAALERLLADPLVAPLLEHRLDVLRLDVGRRTRHVDLAARFGIDYARGIPALVVLDGAGAVRLATRDGELRTARTMAAAELGRLLGRALVDERIAHTARYEPLRGFVRRTPDEMIERARAFADEIARRRTVRAFAPDPVPRAVIEHCLRAAGSAPSGANRQPWHFVAVADPAIKREIREAAEAEERAFYAGRASRAWLEALAPIGTDADKPFLEAAPWLIAIFAEIRGDEDRPGGSRNYYVAESVGIATGFLIAALHHAGLATLTHTPSPMRFLNRILDRPERERPFLLLVAGLPAPDARVPAITRKPLDEIATFREGEGN